MTLTQIRGLRYQRKVEKEVSRLFPGLVSIGPWFRYKVEDKVRLCQPDLILKFDGHICIVEIKYTTTAKAWQQLNEVYRPVVEKAFRQQVTMALITRMFDPAVKFPVEVTLLHDLESVEAWKGPNLGVVSWK